MGPSENDASQSVDHCTDIVTALLATVPAIRKIGVNPEGPLGMRAVTNHAPVPAGSIVTAPSAG